MGRIIRDIGNKMANLFGIGASARRSRCGMEVEFWDEKRNFGGLGTIESFSPLCPTLLSVVPNLNVNKLLRNLDVLRRILLCASLLQS